MITPEQVRAVLRRIDDPELGINVVDLGLVYDLAVHDTEIRVAITMTTPACPMHGYLTNEIEANVRDRFPGVRVVQVDIVWDPPWEPAMMSDLAKRYLGWAV